MLAGTLSADGVPVIDIPVAGRVWRAVIDTGFNGDLELPEALKIAVDARFLCRIRSLLAGGHIIEEDNYLVQFPFDGHVVAAEATFSPGDEILIGTHLLQHYRLQIDFARRRVVLERAQSVDE
jgi:predicted aspartyl protease